MGNEESLRIPAQAPAKQGKKGHTAIVTLKQHPDRLTGKGLGASSVHEGMAARLFPSSRSANWLKSQLWRQALVQMLALRLPSCGNFGKLLNLSKPWCLCGDNYPVINFPRSYCKDYTELCI